MYTWQMEFLSLKGAQRESVVLIRPRTKSCQAEDTEDKRANTGKVAHDDQLYYKSIKFPSSKYGEDAEDKLSRKNKYRSLILLDQEDITTTFNSKNVLRHHGNRTQIICQSTNTHSKMRVSDWVAPSMAVASASYAQLSTAPSTIPSSSISQSQASTMVLTTSSVVSSPSTLLSSDWSSSTEATSSRSSQPTTLMTSISNNVTDTVMSIVTKPVTTKIVDVWITTNSSTSVDPSTVTLFSTVTVSPSSTTTIEPTQVPTGDCKITYLDPGFSGTEASYNFDIKGINWSSEGIHDAARKCGNVLDLTVDKSSLAPFQWTVSIPPRVVRPFILTVIYRLSAPPLGIRMPMRPASNVSKNTSIKQVQKPTSHVHCSGMFQNMQPRATQSTMFFLTGSSSKAPDGLMQKWKMLCLSVVHLPDFKSWITAVLRVASGTTRNAIMGGGGKRLATFLSRRMGRLVA